MIPVTTSATQLQRQPARDERIDQAGLRLEQNIQEVQERLFQVAFEVGLKMGEATQTLRLERLQLESENRSLENDITQLKAVHISELNAAVDGLIAKRNILAEKVRGVVGMFEVFCKTYPESGFPSTDVLSFTLLLDNISRVNYEGLRGQG